MSVDHHGPDHHHRPEDHTARCYCGRAAKCHVYYGSGCGNVCGIHRRRIERLSAIRVTSIEAPLDPSGERMKISR